MTSWECSAPLPTLLAITVLLATTILKVIKLKFQGLSLPVPWNINKTSVSIHMQFLTMKFLVSIQPIFCFSNPLHLISVSLWMRWSCSCITVFVQLCLRTCKYISAPPGPVISLIWGLGLLLQDTGAWWTVNVESFWAYVPLVWKSENGRLLQQLEELGEDCFVQGQSKGVEWECNHHVQTQAWHGHVEIKNTSKSQSMRELWVHMLEVLTIPWV